MTPTQIISTIDAIASKTGNKVSSICQKVLRNPEYYDRLQKRIKDDDDKGKKFTRYLNEVSENESAPGKQREATQ